MNRKRTALALLLVLLLTQSACGGRETTITNGTGPGRMVRRIEIAIHPADADFVRTYVTQENMNEMLTLLRAMETTDYPDTEPDINGGQSYYTATITFANGEQSVYYLLGHTYLRLGDNPWCLIDSSLSRQFVEFIRSHPTDDGSVTIETTVPVETTAPTDTIPPTE